MFLIILLSPLVFLACFALPFVGTICSRENSSKWILFWLLQLAASWTVIPLFGLMLGCEEQMFIKVVIAIGLIYSLNPESVGKITSQIESVIGLVDHQKQNAQEQISKVARQYGIIE